jgi:glucitol/sorbitol PTS system EIIA component
MTEIYRTRVTGAGPLAVSFLPEGMFVTFGDNAPEALLEFCFIIEMNKTTAPLRPGQVFSVDGRAFPITAVGDVARQNLDALGHITVNLKGGPKAKLAGSIHVSSTGEAPDLKVGSVITIDET